MADLEHKLVTGGERFLPFARSRIKALRATGQPYACEKFVIEGSFIECRILPGHDYITINGGGCEFKMESGVVESMFLNYGPMDALPQNYTKGIFHDADITTAYNAGFTKLSSNGTYKTNPGKGSDGQFSGNVTYSGGFRGKLPTGTDSAAFAPAKRKETDVNGVETLVDVERDTNLWLKKYTAYNCPASVFTGRCRLYVQALYGAPLYDGKGLDGVSRMFYGLADKTHRHQPVLVIDSVQYPDDRNSEGGPVTYAGVELNTSSGVFLDEQGKHWLFDCQEPRIDVYPLIADSCGEVARKFLKPDSDLSVEDRHHLEAYILSTCRPDRKMMQTATFGSIVDGNSMGYGWHWNYSGGRADIVINQTIPGTVVGGGRVNSVVDSTHYAVSISKTETPSATPGDFQQSWSASLATISGPSRWCVDRGLHCICYTNGNYIEKMTPMRASSESGVMPFAGVATFYVFYRGDELQLCRVTVAEHPLNNDPDRWTSSDPVEVRATPAISINIRTYQGSGWLKTQPTRNWHFTTAIQVGPSMTDPMATLRIETGGIKREVSAGSITADGPDYVYTTPIPPVPGEPYPVHWQYDTGIVKGPSLAPFWDKATIPSWAYRYGGYMTTTCPSRTSALEMSYWGRCTVTTPQWDSEAIYVTEDQWEQESLRNTGWENMVFSGVGKYVPVVGPIAPGADGPMIFASGWYDANLIIATAMPIGGSITETITKTKEQRTLTCRAGAIDIPASSAYGASMQDNIDAILHSTADDLVYANFNTVSGTTQAGPVIAKPRIPPQGVGLIPPHAVADIDYPVLVGWV